MSEAPADVEAAVSELYRGAPEAFVAARDQLARSLRAAKRRDEATAIAKLRRPSRLAWAFNAARAADAQVAARLDEAVAAVTAAQEGDGNIRQASASLRAAVGELVDTAARTADEAGHPLDRSTLTPAALAVVGDPEALAHLQAGRLGDVPEGGGFGFGLELPSEPAAPSDRKRAGSGRATKAAATKAGSTRAGKAAPAGEAHRAGRGTADKAGRGTADKTEDETDADDDAATASPAADEAAAGPSPEELAAARRAVEDAEGEEAAAAEAVDEAERALSEAGDAVADAEERRAAAERTVAEAEERRTAAEEALAAARTRRHDTGEAVASARAALADLGA